MNETLNGGNDEETRPASRHPQLTSTTSTATSVPVRALEPVAGLHPGSLGGRRRVVSRDETRYLKKKTAANLGAQLESSIEPHARETALPPIQSPILPSSFMSTHHLHRHGRRVPVTGVRCTVGSRRSGDRAAVKVRESARVYGSMEANRPCGWVQHSTRRCGAVNQPGNESTEAHEGTGGDELGPARAIRTFSHSLAVALGSEASW